MNFMNKLQDVNCRYNFKEEEDGKCYSKECSMNLHPDIKQDIQKKGCQVFRRKEVQELIK